MWISTTAARSPGHPCGFDQLLPPLFGAEFEESTRLLLVFRERQDAQRTEHRFKVLGYIPHVKTIRRKTLPDGTRLCDSNIDNLFSFWVGLHARRTSSEVIVLGSGDYGLAGELAEAIHNRHRRRRLHIMTLSLPGSTSQALNASTNSHIEANLEVGQDLLSRLNQRVCLTAARARSRFCTFRSNCFANRVF